MIKVTIIIIIIIIIIMYIKNLAIFICNVFQFVSGHKSANRVHSGSINATHQASRSFSSAI